MRKRYLRRSLTLGDGENFGYFEGGAGRNIILIHGALVTSHDMLVSIFETLASHARVIAVDRPGHGISTRRRLNATPSQQAALIVEAAAKLGMNRPLVVGHSLGATIALEIALAYPDAICGVVAIAPIAFPEPRIEQVLFGHRATLGTGDLIALYAAGLGVDAALLSRLWRSMFLPHAIPATFEKHMAFDEVRSGPGLLANADDAMATAPSLMFNYHRYLSCRSHIELVNGDCDLVVNPRLHAKPLARILPKGNFTWVRGAGHMVHHSHPKLITEIVNRIAA